MKKPLAFSVAAITAALLLSGCTSGDGKGTDDASTAPVNNVPGTLPYSNTVEGAAVSLQDLLRSLDAEMDSSYKGVDSEAAVTDKATAMKAQLPKTFERIDSSLTPEDTVKVVDTFGTFLKAVKAGNEITVTSDAIKIDDKGVATVNSTDIKIAFDKKARQIDRAGQSKFTMVYKDGVWKVSDANINWTPITS